MKSPTEIGTSEYTEKRSRFIGIVKHVDTEEEAKQYISTVKKQYHDARHNCWCYLIDGGAERYSDDGEPQGTAGIPMLEVMKKEGISNVVCVVTRYFGGILLGTGGLLRAYTKAAKDALSASEPKTVIELQEIDFHCSYSDFDTIKNAIAYYDGEIADCEYGQTVHIRAKMPDTKEFEEKYLWKNEF